MHSPHVHSFLWSHIGWVTSRRNFLTDVKQVPDLARYPELRFLDRFNTLVPLLLAAGLFVAGEMIAGTTGPQMLVWGFFISTTALFHISVSINSVAHRVGNQRYRTGDESRNNWWLALLTLGEGWHNNHHHYPVAVRQAHRWWEIDITAYLLQLLAALRIVWGLKPVPARVLATNRVEGSRTGIDPANT